MDSTYLCGLGNVDSATVERINIGVSLSLGLLGLSVALYIGNKQIKLSNEQGRTIDEQNRMIKLQAAVSICISTVNDMTFLMLTKLTNMATINDIAERMSKGAGLKDLELLNHERNSLITAINQINADLLNQQKQLRTFQDEVNKINGTLA